MRRERWTCLVGRAGERTGLATDKVFLLEIQKPFCTLTVRALPRGIKWEVERLPRESREDDFQSWKDKTQTGRSDLVYITTLASLIHKCLGMDCSSARCTTSIADLKKNVGETTRAELELAAESGNTNGWNKRDRGEIQNVGQAHSALGIKCLPSATASFRSHPCSLHSEQCNVSIFFKFKDTKSLSAPLTSTE